MIKSVTVTNYLGESLEFILTQPELSGFVVTSITGLGPGQANINTTEMATSDGSLYNSARLPSRNIVLSLQYLNCPTIEDARQKLYKYFPIKKKLTFRVTTDNRDVEIDGYTETNDPTIFSDIEGSDISIICPNPFFRAAGGNGVDVTVFSGVEPMFEFPFSNDSLSEDLLIMGDIQFSKEQTVYYTGDSESGITMYIHALGAASGLTIYNVSTRQTMKLDSEKLKTFTGSDIKDGDDIVICTERGSKSVSLIREGITTNILNCLAKESDWFQVSKGDNIFAFSAESGSTDLQFRIENRLIYEGV